MKTYQGLRIKSGVKITVNDKPLKRYIYHSPTGLEWGYSGSGPADLALSILSDYFGSEIEARRYHQEFKWDFVSKWGHKWSITDDEIKAWLDKKIAQEEQR